MEIIKSPNNFFQNDPLSRIFIYLAGKVTNELLDYLNGNIKNYAIKNVNKMVVFYSESDLQNKSENEIKEKLKWENDHIKISDIIAILIDDNMNDKYFYDLGKYLSFFHDIYKDDIKKHFIVAYIKELKNQIYLKSELNELVTPIEINEISSYGDLVLKKLEELYKETDSFIDHHIIHTEEQNYWSTNLGPKIRKIFCRAPWPECDFELEITGLYGAGKTAILNWFSEGRFKRFYDYYMVGESTLCQIEINNKNFIVRLKDTGGQDKIRNYNLIKLIKKNCAIFVFDITDRNSFDEINQLIEEVKNLQNNSGNNFIKVLIGNKLDLKFERKVSYEEGDKLADENGMKYFEVSAKSGENMERICNYIYDKLSKLL